MDYNEKLKKVNPVYLLLNIFGPIAVLIIGMAISVALPENVGVFIAIIVFAFAIIWWAFLGRKVYEKTREKTIAELKSKGFTPNCVFNADGCTVIVDLKKGQIAIVFRWNPTKAYVRPASELSNVHVDDGRHGAGFMEGSSCVSFIFTVEGRKIRVNTFTSNRQWKMNSEYITTGIKKAEDMVTALVAAGAKK